MQEMKEKQTRLYAALQNVCQPSTLSSEYSTICPKVLKELYNFQVTVK